MANRSWTDAQQWAIDDRGGSLLVSAAAGSGKTAVLVERVVGLICDKTHPVDVTQLLIVTFSNAAAAEMRQRIGIRLGEMIAENPLDHYLQKQHSLLSSASIRTIHAFCMDLIRDHFQLLPISGDFSIMDEKELDLMKNDAVMECIEAYYEEDHSGLFGELVELLASGRDDKRVAETVFKIYNFARSHPFYNDWLDQKLSMYDSSIPVSETVWGKTLLHHTSQTLQYCKTSLENSKEWLIGDEKLEKAYLPAWESDLAQINNILDYLESGLWDKAVVALRTFTFERLGAVRGDDETKEKAKELRNYCKKLITPLAENYMNATEAEFRDDIENLKPKIELLFGLVKSFGESLDQRKRSSKKMDFSDLEHFALQLLVQKTPNGYAPTSLAEELSTQYRHVLVDEYQDTNEVQDLIFTSLSGQGERLFMVGDVKQSIYSFRLAMPEIFMKKKDHFSSYNKQDPSYPATINLDKNFRSRCQVTESVNYIFSQIMSLDMGEVDYNQEETLKCGAVYPEHSDVKPELLLIQAENVEDDDYTKLEAKEIAHRIDRMLKSGYQVSDKGVLREARPSDFCILMRSPKSRAETYLKELALVGLTGVADSSSGFLDSREVSLVISLLMVLDNPLLDIELVAVMASPMFAFSDDEIAEIRLNAPNMPFYLAVQQAATEKDKKSEELLDVLTQLRYYATTHQADELLLEVYRVTHWLEIVSAMPYGAGRRANLLLLVEHASYYHSMGYKGLGGFTALVRRIKEQGGDLDGASGAGDTGNVIQIISVHRSKGLEFPVVFLADTARQFNKRDLYENTLLHSEYGFACVRRDLEHMTQFPTIPMGAIRLEMQKTMLSEEMRILYVALTRAKEKLIISGTVRKKLNKFIQQANLELYHGKLPSFMVGEVNCYLEWILMALIHHPSCEILRTTGDLVDVELLDDDNPWKVEIVIPEDEQENIEEESIQWTASPEEELTKELQKRLQFSYDFLPDTKIPTKLAVSQVANQEEAVTFRFSRRPKFLANQKLTPTEKGNALHKFMQFADYENARDHLENEIARMAKDEYLSSTEVESLSAEKISEFFHSNLAERIFASPKVYRELRFLTQFGKDRLVGVIDDMGEDSAVVLQGVADCVFIEKDYAVIVDYKTDRVSSMEQLVNYYRKQVEIYKVILEETLGIPVHECILYSFHLSEYVNVLAL